MEPAILDAEGLFQGQRAVEDPVIVSDPVVLQERHAGFEAARAEVDRLYAR